jgi:ATP phosphoribosyltransferase
MTAPFVLAVPSKGRLQENAEAFFTRAGLALAKPRGARDYRGTISGLDNVEIAYLSASEIASQLARGAVHLGVTGEDLVRESIAEADKRVLFIDSLGFGNANVVVAVPQAWIDVRTMADLDDVTTGFRAQHNRRMRVATKYINLTRAFFAAHGIVDYRIVESAGATEGAPAVGTAEMIVDITTSGVTLAANGLKVLDDGVILRSQANLVGARDRTCHPGPHRRPRPRQQIPGGAHALCWLRYGTIGRGPQPLRGGVAIRRADLLWHGDPALSSGATLRARQLFTGSRRGDGFRGLSRLCSRPRQPAVRPPRGFSAPVRRKAAEERAVATSHPDCRMLGIWMGGNDGSNGVEHGGWTLIMRGI